MKVEIEDFGTGWYGLQIGIKAHEIDALVSSLLELKAKHEQHFHLSSDYQGEGGVGDIEFYVQGEDEDDNMMTTGFAIEPNR